MSSREVHARRQEVLNMFIELGGTVDGISVLS